MLGSVSDLLFITFFILYSFSKKLSPSWISYKLSKEIPVKLPEELVLAHQELNILPLKLAIFYLFSFGKSSLCYGITPVFLPQSDKK